MNPSIWQVCTACGRTGESRVGDITVGAECCSACGGAMPAPESRLSDAYSGTHTPSSLELSPEDLAFELGQGALPLMPEAIDRFRVRELLGGGGFGRVYRAFDPRLERDIALKVLRDDRPPPRVTERFFREARAAAHLEHPHIVAVYDAGRDAGRCWIAYQFAPGRPLTRHRDEHTLTHRVIVRIIRQLADALNHAHERGVFHRDVKPANVILGPDGIPRLTDFGLARRLDFDPTMTREGAVLGTPAYMSPEQAEGRSHRADARSDLYSLGVMLHEMLCGRRPAEIPSSAPHWHPANRRPVESPYPCDPAIPRSLRKICSRVLAYSPEDRYPTGRALANDLDRWLNRPRIARTSASVSAACVVGIVLGAGVMRIGPKPKPLPPTPEPTVNRVRIHASTANSAPACVVRKGERVFHRPTCPRVRSLEAAQREEFSTTGEARGLGYVECAICGERGVKPSASKASFKPAEAIQKDQIAAAGLSESFTASPWTNVWELLVP